MQPVPPCSAPIPYWATSLLGVVVRCVICVVLLVVVFLPGFVAFWDSKAPHRSTSERASWYLGTSPPWQLPPWDGSPSLALLSFFLSFIFCLTSFWRKWAAFLDVWCPLPSFRSCFVEFAQRSNDLLMSLCGRKWSPHPTPLTSSKKYIWKIVWYFLFCFWSDSLSPNYWFYLWKIEFEKYKWTRLILFVGKEVKQL